MDLSTRQLRYFVALAEELHFTRAANRLHIAQQSLSARIRELEQALGVTLFLRTTRTVELTPAGIVLLGRCREILAAFDDAVREAVEIESGPSATLTVGFIVSAAVELTAPILAEFELRHPHVHVEMREFSYEDPTVGLASGQVDVGFVRTPITFPRGRYERLFAEPLAICVAHDHPLASRRSVSVTEILDEPLAAPRCDDPAWRGLWLLEAYRNGGRALVVAETRSLNEELDAVALGKCAMITTVAARRYALRPGVRIVPIRDIARVETTIAWNADRETALVSAFVNAALDVRDREAELVSQIERDTR